MIIRLLAGPALLCGVASTAAVAMPGQPVAEARADAPALILVAGGCGPGYHRGFYGACRPNFYRPYGYYRYGYRRNYYRNF